MENIYETCPILENEHYLLRQAGLSDAKELVSVYGEREKWLRKIFRQMKP